MKFLNYTFEQSQSLVTKETVEKLNQKGSWKRFIGLLITSIVIYFFSSAMPMFIKGLTLDQNPRFSWIQWPMIILYVVMYLVYLLFSIKHRRSPMKLKFCTYFYTVVLLAIFTVSAGIMMMTRRNIVSILSGAMFLLSIYYLIRTVPRKLKEAVQNQTEFSPMVALVTEKISDGLVFLSGTGITAGLVLFDRSTGSDVRGSIDAVLMRY